MLRLATELALLMVVTTIGFLVLVSFTGALWERVFKTPFGKTTTRPGVWLPRGQGTFLEIWRGGFAGLQSARLEPGILSRSRAAAEARQLSVAGLAKSFGAGFEWVGDNLFLWVEDDKLHADIDVQETWNPNGLKASPVVVEITTAPGAEITIRLTPDKPIAEVKMEKQKFEDQRTRIVVRGGPDAGSASVH